ncbi:MAG: glycosyltransferase family 2 protein [Bacteroidota bacterium]|nr:glycosyltransferase family 2 protein [Bacteroidota bacterium]
MKVSAFTYVRNGLQLDYPFIESIQSILPIVDEFIVVIGDSVDGTREAVENLSNTKIKIIDTIWDDTNRSGGRIFAEQANIGLDNVSKDADWIFHIQADEVIHETDLPGIKNAMELYLSNKKVEGLLFDFINFFGDYIHYAPSRRFHQKEVRIIKNNPHFRSYKDSQGFRSFDNPKNMWEEKGRKLFVKKIKANIYHYSYVKDPKVQLKKLIVFGNRWQQNDEWINEFMKQNVDGYNYGKIDFLYKFKGTHPLIMEERIKKQDWKFNYDPSKNNMNGKEKFMKFLQDITGKQFFISQNYKTV